MCGIAGFLSLDRSPLPDGPGRLAVMGNLIQHRGPDGAGSWRHESGRIGFAHRRLSIIDLSTGAQPMTDGHGNWITYNGEIYNYRELRREIGEDVFRTVSDTEVILRAYRKWGRDCVNRFRGMFAFALWDEAIGSLFCARDHFGIKPFYYTQVDTVLSFASEAKALLPWLPEIRTDTESLVDYLNFQFCLPSRTLFKDVSELPAGHWLESRDGSLEIRRYWDVRYEPDLNHTPRFFLGKLEEHLSSSIELHLRSDVPVGAFLSGGIDSSLISVLGSRAHGGEFCAFTGKFSLGSEFDESAYARAVGDTEGFPVHEIDITVEDFLSEIEKVIYHLDYPVAGPGSFPQYVTSRLASHHRKVVLGGQGGDEIFGGYTRYLIAYFEQCIKAAIEGTMHNGSFVVTYESIIPSLRGLKNYKPMLAEFWKEGLFDDMDRRYFRLINRAPHLGPLVRRDRLPSEGAFERFAAIFNAGNAGRTSYFDLMTHFDFKTLLPALLQVEDRMSMAHGIESRVPLLDYPLVEFAATMPAIVKFKDGDLKHILKKAASKHLPSVIMKRTDKMGFPTPLNQWIAGPARDFVLDLFSTEAAKGREYTDNTLVKRQIEKESKFGRNVWGMLCLELWQRRFHDRSAEFALMARQAAEAN